MKWFGLALALSILFWIGVVYAIIALMQYG